MNVEGKGREMRNEELRMRNEKAKYRTAECDNPLKRDKFDNGNTGKLRMKN
jgi:hypothetical protein